MAELSAGRWFSMEKCTKLRGSGLRSRQLPGRMPPRPEGRDAGTE